MQRSGYTMGQRSFLSRGRPEASRAPSSAAAGRSSGAWLRTGRSRRRMVAPSEQPLEANSSCRACLFSCQMLMHSAQNETPPGLPSAVSRWRKQRVGSPQHTQGCSGFISKRVYMTSAAGLAGSGPGAPRRSGTAPRWAGSLGQAPDPDRLVDMMDERQAGDNSPKPERGWERRLGEDRRRSERRRRAMLVEQDRRSGWDRRRGGDRRQG